MEIDDRSGGGPCPKGLALLDDDALIRAHRAGCGEAFGVLVERHRDRVYRLLYRLTLDKEDALDLCQLVFWRAYKGLKEYDRQGQFFTWLYRIASNAAIDLLRDRRRRTNGLARAEAEGKLPRAVVGDADGAAPQPGAGRYEPAEDDPARLVLQKELKSEVDRAVQSLSPEHRATLLLRAGEGLSYREIADTLEVPVGTVMSRLHVARERMREALDPYLHGGSKRS